MASRGWNTGKENGSNYVILSIGFGVVGGHVGIDPLN